MVEVNESDIDWGGLFACCDFSRDKIITIYMGTMIDDSINSIYYITNGSIVFDFKSWSKGAPGEFYLGSHMANNLS